MAAYQSPEEVEKEHLRVLGPTLGPLYHALDSEVTMLHAKWLEYRKLYAKSEERIDLLNASAAFFFRIVQDALWDNVLLHIARLTDPPIKGSNRNLSLLCLPDAVVDPVLADDLRKVAEECLNRSKFARDWRNKRLAHNDLTFAVDSKAIPLPGISRQYVEDVLASFRQIMNRIHVDFFKSEMGYEHFITEDDADTLVFHLAVASRYLERKRERFQKGIILPEDSELIPEV